MVRYKIHSCDSITTIMTATSVIKSQELSNSHPVALLLSQAAPETFGTLPNALWSHILTFLGGPVEMKIKEFVKYQLVSYQDLMGKLTHCEDHNIQKIIKDCGFSMGMAYGNPNYMVESLEVWRIKKGMISSWHTGNPERRARANVGSNLLHRYYHRKPRHYHITEFSPATSEMRMQIVLPIRISRDYYPKGREVILLKNTKKNEERLLDLCRRGEGDARDLPEPITEAFAPRLLPCFGARFYKEWAQLTNDVCNMRPAVNVRYKKVFGWCKNDDKDWLQEACAASQLMITKPVDQYWKEDADFEKYSKVQLTYNLSKIRVKNGVKLRPDEMIAKLQKLEAGGAEIIGKPSRKTCEMAMFLSLMMLALRLACKKKIEDRQSTDSVVNGPSKCNANKETFDSAKIPPPPERVGKIISGPGFCML